MNHNEIVGWENPGWVLKDNVVIMMRDAADHPGFQEGWISQRTY